MVTPKEARDALSRVVRRLAPALATEGVRLVDGQDAAPPRPMTRAEALAEARRRWGTNAWVKSTRSGEPELYAVGDYVIRKSPVRNLRGSAFFSWEAAFADADRRAGGAK